MDVLTMFLGGVVVLVTGCALYSIMTDHSFFTSGPVGTLRFGFSKIVHFLIPNALVTTVERMKEYTFHTRNPVFQVVFAALVVLGHVVLIVDMLPVLTWSDPDGSHIFLPITLLFTNLLFYQLSFQSDPGWINKKNVGSFIGMYKYDGAMYKTKIECFTCGFDKPARSKHCSFCQRCVHRFDHHCLWTNNCVGAYNLRYFLPFLLSSVAMCVNGVVISGRCLLLLAPRLKPMEAQNVDADTGQLQSVSFAALVQHLFLRYPRIVVLFGSLLVLVALLTPFILYHLFLVATNQTTNERFKFFSLRQSQIANSNNNASNYTNLHLLRGRFYDKGIVGNLCEAFFPQLPHLRREDISSRSVESSDSQILKSRGKIE